ncbi:MAG: spermidine/putrescine ABC transporter substrate-binding protein [Actinobacteria bacterium]|jgi:spermidine/putrescine-binding protein|nr:spermidine/putrescine ABC transporter substrate-binding protein [Acidimicrobiaceae bacterium]MBP6486064.1 spermidine/putrescine ABC transporter substrate-binding protein [Ilumatobacteraceae bacterium]NMD25999.1 spermidine/putrescine ABC transporter substrate-binding protein [Actinomycetota bacterium]MBK9970201.1 spermidine/putrescine ABC transporter substrate-binding protein [Acidimicrobiaceae bacterium]MBP7888588.1 spermidine/putrescine ABC transporter substrate-binding protein [Ilumatobact
MQPISRRSLFALAAVATPLAFLAACGDDEEEGSGGTQPGGSTPSTADGSPTLTGTVNFLNFTGWSGPTTYADFAAAFPGATVNEIAWASNDDTISKAKGRAGDIDVVLVDGTTFPRLTALGVLAELGDLPNMQYVADQYKGNSWDPENKSFAPTDHGRTGIIYRKDLVPAPPTSWAEFFAMAPQYSGKVAMLDYQGSVIDNVLVMLGKPVGSTDEADLAAVLEVLTTVKPHLLAISTEVGKAVAAGDAVMAMCDAYDAQLALTTNPDVAFVDPSEGQVGYLEGLAILDGPRNDLARAFVDFFLAPENYAAFINNVASPYVQPDNAGIDPVLTESPVINPSAAVVAKLSYHVFLGDDQPKFDAVWDAFKAA